MAKPTLTSSFQSPNLCTIPGCDHPHLAKGLCNRHYRRVRKHGDPYTVLQDFESSPEERFWARVVKTETCWLWTGYRDPKGYGHLGIGNKQVVSAHRYSFFLANGKWPQPMCLHSCDNPPCVNPSHLSEGDNDKNVQEKMDRGRHRSAVGSEQPAAVIDENQARIIKDQLSKGFRATAIARDLDVSIHVVNDIKRGRSWKHV